MGVSLRAISYLTGNLIKPQSITTLGQVLFTTGDGNNISPNQQQCEAYGYTYNKATGTCTAFTFTNNLNANLINENNNIQGSGNSIAGGTNNTYVMGDNNTTNGATRNNIIIGSNNAIANDVNRAFVFGHLGEATTTNSFVIGGNADGDNLGERQSIQLMYGRQTTDGTTVDSYLNNTHATYLEVPDNTAMYFHADCLAVRVGGTSASGAAGDYKSWVERGVVINKSGTLSIQRERDTIKGSGTTTGWQPTGAVSGTNFTIQVKATNNMTVEWALNITLTQIKTGVAL
tara:strand:- start:158 stop:1021 length:864 start_codon:yes stop_codon:yes gene_type:complete